MGGGLWRLNGEGGNIKQCTPARWRSVIVPPILIDWSTCWVPWRSPACGAKTRPTPSNSRKLVATSVALDAITHSSKQCRLDKWYRVALYLYGVSRRRFVCVFGLYGDLRWPVNRQFGFSFCPAMAVIHRLWNDRKFDWHRQELRAKSLELGALRYHAPVWIE